MTLRRAAAAIILATTLSLWLVFVRTTITFYGAHAVPGAYVWDTWFALHMIEWCLVACHVALIVGVAPAAMLVCGRRCARG